MPCPVCGDPAEPFRCPWCDVEGCSDECMGDAHFPKGDAPRHWICPSKPLPPLPVVTPEEDDITW